MAVAILAVALAPTLNALRDVVSAAGAQDTYAINQQRLKARLEEVLANSFIALDAAAVAAGNSPGAISTTYSDAAGTADRVLVTLYRYDGAAATSSDSGLLWVKAAIEGSSLALNTLAAR